MKLEEKHIKGFASGAFIGADWQEDMKRLMACIRRRGLFYSDGTRRWICSAPPYDRLYRGMWYNLHAIGSSPVYIPLFTYPQMIEEVEWCCTIDRVKSAATLRDVIKAVYGSFFLTVKYPGGCATIDPDPARLGNIVWLDAESDKGEEISLPLFAIVEYKDHGEDTILLEMEADPQLGHQNS